MRLHFIGKSQVLFYRVEGDVRTSGNISVDGIVSVSGAIGVGAALEFIDGQQHLIDRTGSGHDAIVPEHVKRAPQGIGFESHDDFHARALRDTCD